MNTVDKCGVAVMEVMNLSAAGTAGVMSFDTKGYDRANIYIMGYNLSAASTGVVSIIELSESDTVTSATSQTAILAFTGGSATSTSVGFVIGGDTTNTGQTGCIELQVNLKKRKRYVGLQVTADAGSTNKLSAIALLSKAEQSNDTAAKKTATCYNLANTMATVITVVNG